MAEDRTGTFEVRKIKLTPCEQQRKTEKTNSLRNLWDSRKANIYNCFKGREILGYRPIKTCIGSIYWKLKMLMPEIKEDLNKWNDISCSWLGELAIVKTLILSKFIYKYNAISVKTWMRLFIEIHGNNLTYFIFELIRKTSNML